jgi:predicted ArsR family transcriptional regulator
MDGSHSLPHTAIPAVPVRVRILAFLDQERHASDVARHLGVSVPNATAQLGRLCRHGDVRRVKWGIYVRADGAPISGAVGDIARGRPVRDALRAALDREMSLNTIARMLDTSPRAARTHLLALVKERAVERVGKTHYRPMPPMLFDLP